MGIFMDDSNLSEKIAAKHAAIIKIAKFRDETVRSRFYGPAKEQCECTRSDCSHHKKGRCDQKFNWKDRGTADNYDAWQAHHWIASSVEGGDHVTNCRILCVPCHIKTESFGRSPS